MARRHLYAILEVEATANSDVIKGAYRRLALIHHPDRSGGSEARFKEIANAYEVLSDEKLRALYDEFGDDGLRKGFDSVAARTTRAWMPQPGFDIEIEMSIPEAIATRGGMFRALYPRILICDACRGNGRITLNCVPCGGSGRMPTLAKCAACEASGKIISTSQCAGCGGRGAVPSPLFGYDSSSVCLPCAGAGSIISSHRCKTCEGRGTIAVPPATQCFGCEGCGRVNRPCAGCNSSGKRRVIVVTDLRFPPGVKDGSPVRFEQLGVAQADGTAGRLFVRVKIRMGPPSPYWLLYRSAS